jgi:hypothetical protein
VSADPHRDLVGTLRELADAGARTLVDPDQFVPGVAGLQLGDVSRWLCNASAVITAPAR